MSTPLVVPSSAVAFSSTTPTTRGSDSSLRAVSSSIVARSMSLNSDAVRGFGFAAFFFGFSPSAGVTSGSTSVTYGP